MENTLILRATEPRFGAKADGVTNDRKAIQDALDLAYHNGGGTVVLDGGKTFLSTGIVIKSNVTLLFEDGAMLLQSPETTEFYKPVGDGYEPYEPVIGHNFSETIKWSHTWYRNYPFIFAPEGSHDFRITGKGTIRMSEETDPDKLARTCPIGFFRAHHFEISEITINNYHGYAMMPFTCDHGLIRNVNISEWSFGNGDGICMMNCRDMRVTGCKMFTGDDSVYIFSSYRDPRKGEWWNSDEPQASENIEIDHNDLASNHCKAFGMILWGIDCPDLEKVEVRNVYVHDNHFLTMGNWNYNPYTTNPAPPPVTGMRFENNRIDAIESNFFETQVSDMFPYHSMTTLRNGDFTHGRVFWQFCGKKENVRIVRGDEPCAELKAEDEAAGLYQGLYLRSGAPCMLFANAKTDGVLCRMFVRNAETGETVAEKLFSSEENERIPFPFRVQESANYHVGIETAQNKTGSITVRELEFAGNIEGCTGFDRITKEGGKIIFYYD